MRPNRKTNVSALALTPASWFQRFSFGLMLLLAIAFLLLSFLKPVAGDRVRNQLTDAFAPALGGIAAPVSGIAEFISTLSNLTELRAENERLLAENERLRQYQTAVMQLEAENKGLRDLLNLPLVPEQRLTVARVIADAGGPFVRNVVVMAGSDQGVRSGLVAMAGGGLAGRIISSGSSSSRVLLINDINAHVPVLLETSRYHAMVTGTNGPELRLEQLPPDFRVRKGDRLITSGVGGIYPPGLPVGVVSESRDGSILVQPLADLGRLELVQILDPGTPEDLLSPESARALPSGVRATPPVAPAQRR